MKKYIHTIIAIFAFQIIHAQTDFRAGYIITSENETISGLIDFREGSRNFELCQFRKSEDAEIQAYKPFEIKGYGFDNGKYLESKKIVDANEGTKNVFMENLVEGVVSLYRYNISFYAEKGDTSFYELIIQKKEVEIDGKKMLKKTKKYLGILSYLLSDCSSINEEIRKTSLNQKSLIKLLEKYHACRGADFTKMMVEKPPMKFSYGVLVGINMSDIKFSSDRTNHLTADFDKVISPIFGIHFDIALPMFNERISVNGNILYLSASYKSINAINKVEWRSRPIPFVERNDVSIDRSSIKIPIGLKYTFPKRNLTPFINLGIVRGIELSSSSLWIKETEKEQVISTNESEAVKFKNNQIGYWVSFGIKKQVSNKLNSYAELRYEITDGISDYPSLLSTVSNFQFIMGLTF